MQENKFPKGVMVTYGVGEAGPRGGRTSVQSIGFDKKVWTLTKAKAWLADHGFLYGKVHETPGFWRFRQEEPKGFGRYRAVKYNPLDVTGMEEEGREDPQFLAEEIAERVGGTVHRMLSTEIRYLGLSGPQEQRAFVRKVLRELSKVLMAGWEG